MKISKFTNLPQKKIIVFDLDGTLTPTKAAMDDEMTGLVRRLLAAKKVAVIGGGKYGLFRMQLLKPLRGSAGLFGNLFLFPTTATSFYIYQSGWKNVYALALSKREKDKIKKAFRDAFQKAGYQHPKKVYGKVIEDRGTQITFSALGQEVVAVLGKKRGVALKEQWLHKNRAVKMKIARILGSMLPEFEVRAAGFTSIDVTKKGIDKAYGLHQIAKHLRTGIGDMLFIGDAIFPGGNDYAIVKTGVDYISVSGHEETKRILRTLLECAERV